MTDVLLGALLGVAGYGFIQLSKQLDMIYQRLGEIAELLRRRG